MNGNRAVPIWDPPIGLNDKHFKDSINNNINIDNINKHKYDSALLPPVVLIPGVGGSQLSALISKTRPTHWYCDNNNKWYLIWLQLSQLSPGGPVECWTFNMQLNYTDDSALGTFYNSTGVEIMVDYFGSTLGFEYLDPSVKSETVYFANLVNSFVKLGYVRGQNLLGAPYDWRLAPLYLQNYMDDLKYMIETAYSVNQSKVAIVAHSLGNLFFKSFLQTVSQEWKDQYILTYVAASPPWVGAFTAVQSLTSGYNFGIPYLPAADAKIVQRTFLSTYFLLPYPEYYGDQVLVSVPGKNYTAQDYASLLSDVGVKDMLKPYKLSFNTSDPYDPPGVDTYCFYGYNLSTVIRENYAGSSFTKLTMVRGDGDGTVPVESLTFCKTWSSKTSKKLVVKGYSGQEHVDLLSYPPFIQDVLSAIFSY